MTDSPDYNLDNISGSGWFVGAPKMDNFTFGSCLVENIQWSAGEGAQIAFLYPGTSSPAVYNTRIQQDFPNLTILELTPLLFGSQRIQMRPNAMCI